MMRKQFVWVATLMLAGLTGCAMCDNAEDFGYSAFGGKWQRDNPYSGRVASAFDSAGRQVFESGMPTEAGMPTEIMEEEEEEEVIEPLMEMPETAETAKTGPDAKFETNRKPANETLKSPVAPGSSATSAPPADGAGLLPPLEIAP